MITLDQVHTYLQRIIAERRLSADNTGLKNAQTAAGVIAAAAESMGDRDTALRFRVLAAEAANRREELGDE
jgi:hypothetical protein